MALARDEGKSEVSRWAAEIRPAHDADSPAVIELIAGCYGEYPGCVLDVETEVPALRAVASHFAAAGGAFWVAEREGGIVGSAGFIPAARGVELHHLYVGPDERGTGLAARLFALVEEAARGQGATEVVCWSDTRFERGHSFYARLGFHRAPMTRSLGDRSLSVEFFFRLPLAQAQRGVR
jgi:N-acetylglutamate synthase-like GNAT family acetyltransferase